MSDIGTARPGVSAATFRAVFDQAVALLGLLDLTGQVIEVNQAWLRFAGRPRAAVIGGRLWEAGGWAGSAEAAGQLRAAVDQAGAGEVVQIEAAARDGLGRWVQLDLALTPVRTAEGQVQLLLAEGRDVTGCQRMETELQASEQRFRLLTHILPVGVFQTNAAGQTIYVNPRWCQISGLSEAEALQDGWLRAVHPDDREPLAAGWQTAAEAHSASQANYRFQLPDGRLAWVLGQAVPEIDAAGAVRGYVGTLTDITEHRLAAAALADSEARFRAVFEGTAVGMALVDAAGQPLLSNRALEEMLGYDTDQLGCLVCLQAGDLDHSTWAWFQELIAGRRDHFQAERQICRSDGRVVWGRLTVSLLPGLHNGQPCAVVMMEDITERKLATEALRRRDQVMQALAYSSAQLLRAARLETSLPDVLAHLGEAAALAEVSLYQADPVAAGRVVRRYAWTAPDRPEPPAAELASGGPGEAGPAGEGLRVPVYTGEIWWGLLVCGAAQAERVWAAAEIEALRSAAGIIGAALARQQSEAAERRHRERAEALARSAARLNAQLAVQPMVTAVCEEVALALQVPIAAVRLYDAEGDRLSHAAAVGVPASWRARSQPMTRAELERLLQQVERSGYLPDIRDVPGLANREMYIELGVRSVALAGLTHGQQTLGVLTVGSVGQPRQFSPDDLELLRALASQAAQAIRNAQLFTESKRHLSRLEALRTIDTAITGSLELNLTLNVCAEQVLQQLQADAVTVLVLNPHSRLLEIGGQRGFRSENVSVVQLRLGESFAGRAALEREQVLVPDLAAAGGLPVTDPLFSSEAFVGYCATPLIAKGQVRGVLEVFRRERLEPNRDWLKFCEVIARQVAIAIDNIALFNDLQRSKLELELAYDTTLEGWSRAMDLRDQETEGHTRRVTDMALRLARAVNLPEEELVHVKRGALLHDIGKMGIPDSILLKPGKLTDEEWQVMRRHPVYAFELLQPIRYLRPALAIPYSHHERWDGTGYPLGLKGEQIPAAARLFAVVDVWDALRSNRPYRAGWPEAEVQAHLRGLAGTHFDPRIVEAFLQVLNAPGGQA